MKPDKQDLAQLRKGFPFVVKTADSCFYTETAEEAERTAIKHDGRILAIATGVSRRPGRVRINPAHPTVKLSYHRPVFIITGTTKETSAPFKTAGFSYHGYYCQDGKTERGYRCDGCAVSAPQGIWWTPDAQVAARFTSIADTVAKTALGMERPAGVTLVPPARPTDGKPVMTFEAGRFFVWHAAPSYADRLGPGPEGRGAKFARHAHVAPDGVCALCKLGVPAGVWHSSDHTQAYRIRALAAQSAYREIALWARKNEKPMEDSPVNRRVEPPQPTGPQTPVLSWTGRAFVVLHTQRHDSEQLGKNGARLMWHVCVDGVERDGSACRACPNKVPQSTWWTTDAQRAINLVRYADDSAKTAILAAQAAFDKRQGERVAEVDQNIKTVEASRAEQTETDLSFPKKLHIDANGVEMDYKPYQKAGIQFALRFDNVLIADEMGVGKTMQALGIINATPRARAVLIVCPGSLMENWKREAERWLVKDWKIHIVTTMADVPPTSANLVIVNYDKFSRKDCLPIWSALMKREWDVLVADECHYLSSDSTGRAERVLGRAWSRKAGPGMEGLVSRAARRVFMTGTPIQNRPKDVWNILRFLSPEDFGNHYEYLKRYCDAHYFYLDWGKKVRIESKEQAPPGVRAIWNDDGASNLLELQNKARAHGMIRRLKSQVLAALPPKHREMVELDLTAEMQTALREEQGLPALTPDEMVEWEKEAAAAALLMGQMEEGVLEEGGEDYKTAAARLKGADVKFRDMSEQRHKMAKAKLPSVLRYVQELSRKVPKIVVFAHHQSTIEALAEKFGKSAVTVYGKVPMKKRMALVDRFQTDPTCKIFIGQLQAAGVGLTLTAAHHVVMAEVDWVPGVVQQAEDRAHRLGQTQPVTVHYLVVKGSLDGNMVKTLLYKQRIQDRALDKEVEEPLRRKVLQPERKVVEQTRDVQFDERKQQTSTTSYAGPARWRTPEVRARETAATAAAIPPRKVYTDTQMRAAHRGLQMLAGMCDGARTQDGHGFNKFHSEQGKELARRPALAQSDMPRAAFMVNFYRGQLPSDVVSQTTGSDAPRPASPRRNPATARLAHPDKAAINKGLMKAGFDGRIVGTGVAIRADALLKRLARHGITTDTDLHHRLFSGRNGQVVCNLTLIGQDSAQQPVGIENSTLVVSWHERSPRRHEVVGYLS